MYTWRHDQVLKVIVEVVRNAVEKVNARETTCGDSGIRFVQEGDPGKKTTRQRTMEEGVLAGQKDWKLECDLSSRLIFPVAAAVTSLRPDIVVWSESSRAVLIGELTVPWEENVVEAHEFKLAKYEPLVAECQESQWCVHCLPFEVGCRGFVGGSLVKFLRALGVSGRERRSATRSIGVAAERASAWIWAKHRNGPG